MELGNATAAGHNAALIGDDIEVVRNRRTGRQGSRISAGHRRDILTEIDLDARNAAAMLMDCDE